MSTEETISLAEKVDAAFRRAALRVIERARQTGTPVIVWEDGRIRELSVEDYERREAEKGDGLSNGA